jgi:hypothetical protein
MDATDLNPSRNAESGFLRYRKAKESAVITSQSMKKKRR